MSCCSQWAPTPPAHHLCWDMDSDALGLCNSGTNLVKDKAHLLLRGTWGQLPGGGPHCNSMAFLPPAFQAFSAFYYNFKFLNLTEGQSLAAVRETIEHFCTRSWEDVRSPRWEAVGKLHKQRGPGVGEEERGPLHGKPPWLLSCAVHSGAIPEQCEGARTILHPPLGALLAHATLGKGQPGQLKAAKSPHQHRSWGWRWGWSPGGW